MHNGIYCILHTGMAIYTVQVWRRPCCTFSVTCHFLNGIPSNTLLSHKRIYQPGILRKAIQIFFCGMSCTCMYALFLPTQVALTAIPLKSLCIAVRGVGSLSVHQMQQNTTYTLLLMSLPTSSLVYPASSVIASLRRELVNVGNSVQFSTGPDEVIPCLYKCSMSCVKLPGQLLLFAAFRVYMTYVNCIAVVIPTMQVYFGVLAACFNVQGEGISYCVIQLFESVDTFGTQVINE